MYIIYNRGKINQYFPAGLVFKIMYSREVYKSQLLHIRMLWLF